MRSNRSVPPCPVIPVLEYPDPSVAAEWLGKAFGFTVRLRIANHRIQMRAGDGCFTIREGNTVPNHSIIVQVRIEDVLSHCERSRQAGAKSSRRRRTTCTVSVSTTQRTSTATGGTSLRRSRTWNLKVGAAPRSILERAGACRSPRVERVKGIEPSSLGWEPRALPLSYTRRANDSTREPSLRAIACRLPFGRLSSDHRRPCAFTGMNLMSAEPEAMLERAVCVYCASSHHRASRIPRGRVQDWAKYWLGAGSR